MMPTREFLTLFKREITLALPGEKAHQRMAPVGRAASSIALQMADTVRESAVAVVLYERNGTIECILTQRPEYDGNHSGQVSFPGGKKDPTDLDLEATARRECYEEIGIPEDLGILLGQLTDVFIPVSSFLVKPFVFFHEQLPTLSKDEREVAEILSFPLFDLTKEEIISTMEVHLPSGAIYRDVPYFDLANKKVWGATALILSELREVLMAIH